MNPAPLPLRIAIATLAAFIAAAGLAAFWLWHPEGRLIPRMPGTDKPPELQRAAATNPILAGKVVKGDGQPANLPGAWPGFRGPNGSAVSPEPIQPWPAKGPHELWSVEVGEGYGGAAVFSGQVFVMDYVRKTHESVLRCLSLADGKEIWRFGYPLSVKRNHGITRTVPAVTEKAIVVMDPKCNVLCVDIASGNLRWGKSLVNEFGTIVPQWYAGQCPLIDGNSVILAPGGPQVLLMAVDLETGKELWRTPNPHEWKMTHVSVVPMEFAGQRTYVYCGSGGVVGVSAKDGSILWETTDWKIAIATVATPIPLADGRIFFSGGYNAGSLMLQLTEADGKITAKTLFKLPQTVFGATQQTPILLKDHIYGIRPDGQLVCLDLKGKLVWASGAKFGLGPVMIAGGLIFAMDDEGKLSLFEASPEKCVPLGQADVFQEGHESWGPMALAGGRLIVRDFTRMTCLDVGVK